MSNILLLTKTRPMTEIQRENWLIQFIDGIAQNFMAKFRTGQREHGGDLGSVPTAILMDEMLQEHLDGIAYWGELQRRFSKADVIVISRKTVELVMKACYDCASLDPEVKLAVKQVQDLLSGKAETGI